MTFTGLEIPWLLANFGLVGTKNLGAVPHDALIKAQNVAFNQGTLHRAGGSTPYNATAITGTPKLRGVFDWWPTASIQRLIVYGTDGKLYRDTGGGSFATTLKSGLAADGIPVFCEGGAEALANNKKLFFTTGSDVVQVLSGDGVTTSDIGVNKPADWSGANQPRSLFPHRHRVFGILGHQVYWTMTTDHENYAGAGSGVQPVYPGQSSYLQGGVSFKELAWLFKWPRGIYKFDDSDTTVANWTVLPHTDAIGLAGPLALCVTDDDVLFMSEIGHLHKLSYVRANDVTASDLTAANDLGSWTRDNLNVDGDALTRVQAIYYPDKKEAWFACPAAGATKNNLVLIVDLNKPGTPRVRWEDKDVAEGLALWRDAKKIQRPIAGDDAGQVWKLDQAAKDRNGAGYTTEFQLPHTDFGWYDAKLATRRKNFAFLESVFQPIGAYDLSVDVVLDGDYAETITFAMGAAGATLGSFVLGTDKLAGDILDALRKRLHGSARRISLAGRLSGAGQDFSLSLFHVGLKPGGTRT